MEDSNEEYLKLLIEDADEGVESDPDTDTGGAEPEPEPEPQETVTITEPAEEEITPKPRKKREMTPERKAQLLENLRRGRETRRLNALKNKEKRERPKQQRKPTGKARKLADIPEDNEKIRAELLEDDSNLTIKNNVEELKEELKTMKKNKTEYTAQEIQDLKTQIQELKISLRRKEEKEQTPKAPQVPKVQQKPKNNKSKYDLYSGSIWDKFK
jgi:hypothetical protein